MKLLRRILGNETVAALVLRLCEFLARHLSGTTITNHSSRRDTASEPERPIFYRYYLVQRERIGVYLHHYVDHDPAGLHCHPADFRTLILHGGYWESLLGDGAGGTKMFVRFPGDIVVRQAETLHRLSLSPRVKYGGGSWSLFIRFRRRRTWGFVSPEFEKSWTPVLHRTDERLR